MEKITDLPKLPQRKTDSHKGDFGKVLVIAGSVGMSGAAAIAAKSALRSGAGLVNLAVPKSILPIIPTPAAPVTPSGNLSYREISCPVAFDKSTTFIATLPI